jgi:peptidoglycan/LPS O-acetylase OafA/YrhL
MMETLLPDPPLVLSPPAPAKAAPATAAAPSRPVAIESLNSLRGLAALWVLGLHFRDDLYRVLPDAEVLDPLLGVGWLAVPYFFILSGFVLAYNYADDFHRVTWSGYFGFIGRRWLRIYPVHFATLMAVLALVLSSRWLGMTINREDKYSFFDFVLNLFLVQTWVPHHELSWNGPSWSISSEWFAYLLFPFLCVALHRRSPFQRAGLALLACLASVGFFVWAIGMPFSMLVSVLPTFLTGCAIATTLRHRVGPSRVPRYLPDLIVLTIVCTPLLLRAHYEADRVLYRSMVGLLVACFAGTIYCFGSLGNSCARLWRSGPLLYLGEISYSLYMTHILVLMVGPKLLPTTRFAESSLAVRLCVLAAYALFFMGAALASYYLVEKPFRKRWWRRSA